MDPESSIAPLLRTQSLSQHIKSPHLFLPRSEWTDGAGVALCAGCKVLFDYFCKDVNCIAELRGGVVALCASFCADNNLAAADAKDIEAKES